MGTPVASSMTVPWMAPEADAAWLTVTAGVVDPNGLGAYTASVDRANLAVGRYSASIEFSVEGGAQVVVPVSLQVGAAQTVGDAGFVYVLLLDSKLNPVAQVRGRSAAGAFPFQFADVAPGEYLIVAGTDSDNDDLVCDAGEVCGAWPTLGAPNPVTVENDDVAGLDFVAGFAVTLGSTATSVPAAGLSRRPSTSAFGSAPRRWP